MGFLIRKPNWDAVTDWNASGAVIAKQAGTNTCYATREKKARGGAMWNRYESPVYYDWDSVNWGVCDMDIAMALGCSRERVRQKRKKLTNTHSCQRQVYFNDGTPWAALEV